MLRARWPGTVDVCSGHAAIDLIQDPEQRAFHVVLCELRLAQSSGEAVLRAALDCDAHTAVVLMSADAGVEMAVSAMSLGAYDFAAKPLLLDQLELRVAKAVEHGRLLDEVKGLRSQVEGLRDDFVVANSESMREAVAMARSASAIRSTVLLTGETEPAKKSSQGSFTRSRPERLGPSSK